MSELIVHIKDFNAPISVSKVENGIEVGKREVLVEDYIRSLMKSLEDEELLGFLMEKRFSETILKYLEEVTDEDTYRKVFQMYIDQCEKFTGKDIKENELFIKLLTQMVEKVNVKEVSEPLLPDLLKNILLNVEKADIKDMTIYNRLFRVLLEKVNINKGSSLVVHDFLKVLLERLKDQKNFDDLKEVFDIIVKKAAKADWLENVIKFRRPETASNRTPILPSGTIFFKDSIGGLQTIIMEVPKHQRDVQYKDLHYKQVGHPNLLFVYQITGRQIQNMMIFSKDSKPLTEDSMLYHYPYSHVYMDGKVCWGFRSEVITSLNQLSILNKVFLETPNNHDLARKGSVEKYIQLQGKEFPDTLLETTNLTFGQLVDSI